MPRANDHTSATVIGVTGPDSGGWPAWIFTRWALARAGAQAVRITPAHPIDPQRVDGLVIGGGADVSDLSAEPMEDPRASVSAPPPHALVRWPLRLLDLLLAPIVLTIRMVAGRHKSDGPDPARDALEIALLSYAREHDVPVLGICRGAQLMSVAEGGTLLRDLRTLYDERPHLYTVLARRAVHVSADSRLHEIVGLDDMLVNSLHFHAVGEAGEDMRIVARETSGVPQAIEHTSRAFWVGVQWHPEYLPHHQAHQALFEHLVTHAQTARAHVSEHKARSTRASTA